ncbi:hypothetical protein BJX61DRAFT_547088 [Aspergillus egyptiacus]|nr:hypothetical protein BJX61DRAFT_547088 [Aspergillus egyptiacus]
MPRTTAPAEFPIPITYTPTTHRISKAKKGKRVHACEYPGCNKVFTRAEHKRRHELNHNPEALYRCTEAGCKKAFHRPDLLARHLERHELEAQMENTAHWDRPTSARQSIEQYEHISQYTAIPPVPAPYIALTQPPTSMSKHAVQPDLTINGLLWNTMEMPSDHQSQFLSAAPIQESLDDSRYYSTPETCSSPSPSDGTTFSVPPYAASSISSTSPGISDTYADPILDSELTSSPAPMHATLDEWSQAEAAIPIPPANMPPMPVSIPDSIIHPALQYQSQQWQIAHSQPMASSYDSNFLAPVPYQENTDIRSWSL